MAQRSEDGVGKTSDCPSASSARFRSGPDPRSPYRPAAVIMAASIRPDTRKHLNPRDKAL